MEFREGRKKKQGLFFGTHGCLELKATIWGISGNGTEHSKSTQLRGRMAELYCNSDVVLPFYQLTESLDCNINGYYNLVIIILFGKQY